MHYLYFLRKYIHFLIGVYMLSLRESLTVAIMTWSTLRNICVVDDYRYVLFVVLTIFTLL